MYRLSSDIKSYQRPVSITHQGKAIYFVCKWNEQLGANEYIYNVLNPNILSRNDSLDWEGNHVLTFPEHNSLAGFNILRTEVQQNFEGYFTVLSDQKYIYVFRSSENRIYVSRYLMVETPNPQKSGEKLFQLQPAWELRYGKSQKPDTPANESDSQSFFDMEGHPFVEPQYIISLGAKDDSLQIKNGYFSVDLIPTNDEEILRWQIFVVNDTDKCLYTYSFERTEDGWFSFNPDQYNKENKLILPDHILSIFIEENSIKEDIP